MNKLKAIKIIVSLLTFILVLGTLTVLTLVIKKAKKSQSATNKELFLNEPYGSKIKSISHNNNNTYLLITQGGKQDRIFIIDNKNNIISNIFINEAKNGRI